MKQSFATAQTRISLLGNPSDIYGGFGFGFPIWNWQPKVYLDDNISITEKITLLQASREVFPNIIQTNKTLAYDSSLKFLCKPV